MAMPKAYEGNEPYIFISYAHKDSDKVIPMIQALQDRGFRVWFDAGIEAGSEWPAYIAMHLSNCGCFIPFLTQNYMASDNCRQEIYFALRKKRTLLPVYLEEAELDIGLEMQLSPIQALMLQKTMGTDALLQEMCKSAKLKPCMGQAPAPTEKPTPKPASAPQPAQRSVVPKPTTPAELYQQGKKLYDKSRYTESFPLLQKAAEQGYADAQFQLGWCYFVGNGVSQNMSEATKWYRNAADQNHTKAQYELGYCFFKGFGVAYSMEEAAKWYQKAAELGFAKAQYELARCYHYGYGVAINREKAIHWMQKAAMQKYKDAASFAQAWSEDLQFKSITPEECLTRGKECTESQQFSKAFEFFQMGAQLNNTECQYLLGNCYYNGNGVTKDLSRAVQFWKQASEQGHLGAINSLGVCYDKGEGVPKDSQKAVALYRKAMAAGNVKAMRNLGLCYQEGKGVPQDHTEAVRLFRLAADQGNPAAMNSLGIAYEKGQGVSQDMDKAFSWYQDAADNGSAAGAYNLGRFYEQEKSFMTKIIADPKAQAIKWYQIASGRGSLSARRRLDELSY